MALLQKARNQLAWHPWTALLRSIRSREDIDGVERVSTEAVFEALDIPPVRRAAEAAKQLRRLILAFRLDTGASTARDKPRPCGGCVAMHG